MDISTKETLLAPHNLALERIREPILSPSDLPTLAKLDPLAATVLEILNDNSRWSPVRDAVARGLEVPPDAVLAVRTVTGMFRPVHEEQFIVLASQARTALEQLCSLSRTGKAEVGLLSEDSKHGFRYSYQIVSSFDGIER